MSGGDVPESYWKALFQFANRVGPAGDSNDQSTVRALSNEDKEWLQSAMSELVKETDPVRQMKSQMEVLLNIDFQSPCENKVKSGEDALATLQGLCCEMDNASDFHKIGGYRLLCPLLASPCASFRWESAALIGELCANHQYSQTHLREAGILPVLLELLDKDEDGTVKTKALYAISCLTTDPAAEKEFSDLDGLSYVLRAIQHIPENERFQTKAAFLLKKFAQTPEHRDTLTKMGFIQHFASVLGLAPEGSQLSEQTLGVLLALCKDNPAAISECRRPELKLRQILQFKLNELQVEAEEEGEMAEIGLLPGIAEYSLLFAKQATG